MVFMKVPKSNLASFLKWSSRMAGKPITFVIVLTSIVLWCIIGLFAGFTETWLLVINTAATITATLMVFIIQNTQTRENKALHLKVDELLISIKEAETELAAIEEWEEEELEKIKKKLGQKKTNQLQKEKREDNENEK
jgi:low affinity Fe/Cu permease